MNHQVFRMPKFCCYLLIYLLLGMPLAAQRAQQNPFEVAERLPLLETEETVPPATLSPRRPSNPFDIGSEREAPAIQEENRKDINQGPLLVRRSSEPSFLDARGRSLGIHVLLLFFMALLWIFFRPILIDMFQAALNEGLLTQLYRRRESGQFGIFFLAYTLFFLVGGFFIYLMGQAFDWFPSDQPWHYWVRLSLLLFALMLAKHIALYWLGWLFDLKTVLGKYSFVIMLFAIISSMLLLPLNLLISYAPSSYTILFAYTGLTLLLLLYLFRSFRALLLASKYLSTNFLHFLLYLCAVEAAPVWVLYQAIQR